MLSGLLQMNATISGTSKKMVYKVEKGTQYEEQKKDVGRKRQSTDELLSKRDDCTSRTVLNRVKEQEKAIALLSKEIHLGGKSAFLHCLAMSFSAKNSTKNVTSWDGSLCSDDLVDTANRAKAPSTSKVSVTVEDEIVRNCAPKALKLSDWDVQKLQDEGNAVKIFAELRRKLPGN